MLKAQGARHKVQGFRIVDLGLNTFSKIPIHILLSESLYYTDICIKENSFLRRQEKLEGEIIEIVKSVEAVAIVEVVEVFIR